MAGYYSKGWKNGRISSPRGLFFDDYLAGNDTVVVEIEGVEVDSGGHGLRPDLDVVFGRGEFVFVDRVSEDIVDDDFCLYIIFQKVVVHKRIVDDRVGIDIVEDDMRMGEDILFGGTLLHSEIDVEFEAFRCVIAVKIHVFD